MEIGTARICIGKPVPCISWCTLRNCEGIHQLPYALGSRMMNVSNTRSGHSQLNYVAKRKACVLLWRKYVMPVNTEESSWLESEDNSTHEKIESDESVEDPLSRPLSSEELKALFADKEREKLLRKLSEANQQNRFLKRELYSKEDILVNFKSELAVMEQEIQALVTLAEEIAQLGIPEGTRRINGKYIQSHLLSRLQAVHEKLKEQIKDVEAAQSKEVSIFWMGMAESVQVMGSFDGWSQGEHLSPEYDGSFTKFTTTIMLRPGRYEIKFLVDGVWQLSPEYPAVGEGLTQNNLLIVE